MNSIGTTKTKILGKLTESYASGDKKKMKNIISLLKKNKDFRELYLIYEEIENKYFDDENIAKLYVEEIVPILKEQFIKTIPFINELNEKIGDGEYEKNKLYENLDILLSRRTIHNVDSQLLAKQNLIKHLTTKKEEPEKNEIPLVMNESLFYAVLANNYNVLYENELTDDERNELKEFISISDQEVKTKTEELKEEILGKVSTLLVEDADPTLVQKLEDVKNEVNRMKPTKYNLYKLQQLKTGLI